MNCHHAKQYMFFLAEGSLSPELDAALKGHLADCKNCSYLYNELRLTLNAINTGEQVKVNPWFVGRVEQEFLTLRSKNLNKNKRLEAAIKYLRIVPVAASLAVALWVGILLGYELSQKFIGESTAEDLGSNLYGYLVAEDIYYSSLETFFLINDDK